MHHLPFTLLAYFLNSVAVVIDKILLTDAIPNPLIYIFYISFFSLAALPLLVFTHVPTLEVFLLASGSTILWTVAMYFLYRCLQLGNPTRVIPVVGTLTPLFLILQSIITRSITATEFGAVMFLVIGLLFLTLGDWRGNMSKRELYQEVLSSILFAISYILLREAYLQEQFLTVLVWSRLILIPLGAFLIIIPETRRVIFATAHKTFRLRSKMGALFLVGQAFGGANELLLTFSISLANPALVNSIQGVQYVFIFIFTLFLAKRFPHVFPEKHTRLNLLGKALGIVSIGAGLYILAFASA